MNPVTRTALIAASTFATALTSAPLYGQTAQSNPLIRPNLKAPEVSAANLPPVPAQGRSGGESGTNSKAAQDEFVLRNQQLNAERVPLPLRLLLAPVYVTAISGDTAILRQPLPLQQQVTLLNQGNMTAAQGIPGMAQGTNPQLNQFQGQPGMQGNLGVGQMPGLSPVQPALILTTRCHHQTAPSLSGLYTTKW
jgi:hypothetical protein